MSESQKNHAHDADGSIAPRPIKLTTAPELQKGAHRLLEHGPRPRMSIAAIQQITSVFRTQYSRTEPDWLLPPDLMLFYTKGVATPPTTDNMRSYILDFLRAHDAVFILAAHKNIPIPQGWITALQSLKLKLTPDIDFDFVFVPSSTNETFGRLYINEYSLTIPLVHDKNICTTDDVFIDKVEKCVVENASPVHKRCRAVQEEVAMLSAISHGPVPTPPRTAPPATQSSHPADSILQKWDAQYRAEIQEARKIRQRIITSSSR